MPVDHWMNFKILPWSILPQNAAQCSEWWETVVTSECLSTVLAEAVPTSLYYNLWLQDRLKTLCLITWTYPRSPEETGQWFSFKVYPRQPALSCSGAGPGPWAVRLSNIKPQKRLVTVGWVHVYPSLYTMEPLFEQLYSLSEGVVILMWNIPISPCVWRCHPQLVAPFGKDVEPSPDGASLKKVGHRGWTLMLCS